MITAGIDVGAKNVKVVILKDGNVVGKNMELMEMDRKKSIKDSYDHCLTKNDLLEKDIGSIMATGAGAKSVDFAAKDSTAVTCIARGIFELEPSVKTVIDIGANESIAVKLGETGKVIDFALNEKCAAGAGSFVEAMARAMEVSIDEFADFSLKSDKTIPINAQCVIFAESEVVSLVHEDTDRNDICRAVHDAMAGRIASMARKVRIESPVALVGGVSHNKGMVDSLKNELGLDLIIVENPEYVSAYGAALLAESVQK